MSAGRGSRGPGGIAWRLVRSALGGAACLALALALAWTCASEAGARTLHVSPTGSDNAAGTSRAPFRTIARALHRAGPGDKIIVRQGVYPGPLRIVKGGTERRPLEIVSEHGGLAIIDGSGTPWDTDLVTIAADHVRFSGFTVRASTRSGIAVWRASDVTIAHTFVSGSRRSGIWVGGPRPGESERIRIVGNTVTNNCLENQRRSWSAGWPRAIAVDLSKAATVTENVVAENYGEGIGLLSSHHVAVTGNVVFDNFSVGIYIDNAQRSTITRNLVFSTGNKVFFRDGRPANGILIANEPTEFSMPSREITAKGNILIGLGNASYLGDIGKTDLVGSAIGPNHTHPWMRRDDVVELISGMLKAPFTKRLDCGPVLRCPQK